MTEHVVPTHASTGQEGYRLAVHEVVLLTETDPYQGRSPDEAQQRLIQAASNELPRFAQRGALVRHLLQLHHPRIYVLLGAAIATTAMGEWVGKWVDGRVIVGVVAIITVIGYIQESQAAKTLETLAAMARTEAPIIRDSARIRVPSTQTAPGDVVVLEGADKAPTDVRLTSLHERRIDESALTGESAVTSKLPVELPACTPFIGRRSMAYSGRLVTRGQGQGVMADTDPETDPVSGRIHRLVDTPQTLQTPLTRKLTGCSRILLDRGQGRGGAHCRGQAGHPGAGDLPTELSFPGVLPTEPRVDEQPEDRCRYREHAPVAVGVHLV
ncbi:cation-transporting P-type ATPase, partial [Lipingzhangella sp. LS1_29]